MKNSFYLSKCIFLQHEFDSGIFQLTNQNSDQSKFKQTLTNQNSNSLSMWRVYNLHHTSVFTYSHANTPLGQSERAYYLSYFIKHNNPVISWTVYITEILYCEHLTDERSNIFGTNNFFTGTDLTCKSVSMKWSLRSDFNTVVHANKGLQLSNRLSVIGNVPKYTQLNVINVTLFFWSCNS